MTTTIVFANGKGGVGKSTLSALLVEYCNHVGLSVGLTDADPNATTQTWANHCAQEDRPVVSSDPEVLVVDTAGTSGGALLWIQKASLIVCPFRANFADLDLTATWFSTLHSNFQQRFLFVPNMLGRAKEHELGVGDIEALIQETGHGELLPGIRGREAIYPTLLKGSGENFFAQTSRRVAAAQREAELLCHAILTRAGFEFEEAL